MIRFILNEKEIATALPRGMTLLDFIRYHQHLTGTKIGCREGDCGACTVLVGEIINDQLYYESMTSCLVPLGNAAGKHIVTVEGINFPDKLNPVQQAMADCGATQCGFCTPGFVVSLAGFCLNDGAPTIENAIAAVDGNICRCTGYKSIERAAGMVAEQMTLRQAKGDNAIGFVTQQKILPAYFSGIKDKLQSLLKARLQTPDPGLPALPIGGGTDLYVQKHEDMVHADIRFLFDRPELNNIRQEGNRCVMGASVTVSDLMASPIIQQAFPDFKKYSKLVSSTPIRNMATIGGNFVNASPIGDFTIFFLALDAQLTLTSDASVGARHLSPGPYPSSRSGEGSRTAPLREFYKGYKQLDKKPEEYIESISFELPGKGSFFNFEKVSKRTHLDIASVNSAICLLLKNGIIEKAGLSAGGVGPVPLYLKKTSDYLKGKTLRQAQVDETVQGAIEIMKTEISPISDVRGSKEYKSLLLGQLIKSHLLPLVIK
ncbi:MAG: FAD binding domain-containing protein [Bacteroidota bacterium]